MPDMSVDWQRAQPEQGLGSIRAAKMSSIRDDRNVLNGTSLRKHKSVVIKFAARGSSITRTNLYSKQKTARQIRSLLGQKESEGWGMYVGAIESRAVIRLQKS